MTPTIPQTKDLVLIGGGHTHALVLRKWGMGGLPGVRVSVISPGPTAAYSGMLPGYIAGHYSRDDLDIDLVRLARFAGARLITGPATALDPVARVITVAGRAEPVSYDVASVDIGITSEMPALPGFAAYGFPAKPLGRFASAWADYMSHAPDPRLAVIGGGVAGAELAMAMAHRLRAQGLAPEVALIDQGRVLSALSPRARARVMEAMQALGVTPIEHAQVRELRAGRVCLADGREIASAFTTGAAGARPQDWLAATGLECHEGYLSVGPTLQTSAPDVFAVGDCAHLAFAPRPKAGVFAVRQAPVLYDNLMAQLSGQPLRAYKPQKDYLKLIALGDKTAVADKFGLTIHGRALWRLKDGIDAKFMAQFRELPAMTPSPPAQSASGVAEIMDAAPLCSGCGGKVGRGALASALGALAPTPRADILSLPGDDAACLVMGGVRQVISTDHLSAVTQDPALMTRIAAIHALGDIWAMGACPQAALISLILPRMSATLQTRTMAEITHAAREVLGLAGAALIGGHSSQGEAMTIGFTVTGLLDGDPITLAGAQPGDALILTKPLGVGTILAGEMRGMAEGGDVLAAFAQMLRPQSDASRILAGAHAMTDVTGFGLAGHLSGICRASGTGAVLDALPLLPGALALAQAGVRSSIFADNVAGALPVDGPEGAQKDLLFDPQTCGGLLAAVDPDAAGALLSALRGAGHDAHQIGQITAGDRITLRL